VRSGGSVGLGSGLGALFAGGGWSGASQRSIKLDQGPAAIQMTAVKTRST
jgi:hypothetical protein